MSFQHRQREGLLDLIQRLLAGGGGDGVFATEEARLRQTMNHLKGGGLHAREGKWGGEKAR